MVFVGICGIKDPARPEVAPAIADCTTAGIRVIMITGDTQPTAEAIAREIGIFSPREKVSLLPRSDGAPSSPFASPLRPMFPSQISLLSSPSPRHLPCSKRHILSHALCSFPLP